MWGRWAGEEDIKSLEDRLRGADDSNFGLFNYVNEVNAEVDLLEEQIGEISSEVERYRRQASAQDAAQRAAILVSPTLFLSQTHTRARMHTRDAYSPHLRESGSYTERERLL